MPCAAWRRSRSLPLQPLLRGNRLLAPRIYALLNPLMRMTSIEAAILHNVETHQRLEEQLGRPGGERRREKHSTR